jgi:pimeloyl-ACP methyl ester carboxylesterase
MTVKEQWNGYDSLRFTLNEADCIIVHADSPLKDVPWIWKVRYFNSDRSFDLEMLRCGFHIAHIDISELSGGNDTMERMNQFYHYLTKEFSFSPLPVLEAYSRGAFPALNWAIRNPENIGLIALNDPICNLESWQKTPQEMEYYREAGLADSENRLIKEWDPLQNLDVLVKAGIPLAAFYDPESPGISSKENAEALLCSMRNHGGITKEIVKKSSFSNDITEKLVPFTLNHRKAALK